jgi:hypothetical protein
LKSSPFTAFTGLLSLSRVIPLAGSLIGAEFIGGASFGAKGIVSGVIDSNSPFDCGEMAEWLKAHAWKACIPQGIQGSNPCLSATSLRLSPDTFCFLPFGVAPKPVPGSCSLAWQNTDPSG